MIKVYCEIIFNNLKKINHRYSVGTSEENTQEGMKKLALTVKSHMNENFNNLNFEMKEELCPQVVLEDGSIIKYCIEDYESLSTDSLVSFYQKYLSSLL